MFHLHFGYFPITPAVIVDVLLAAAQFGETVSKLRQRHVCADH